MRFLAWILVCLMPSMVFASPIKVHLSPSSACVDDNHVTVSLNVDAGPFVLVGGQYFLSYDTSKLAVESIETGDEPFTLFIYSHVDPVAGTIDYADGIQIGGQGTSSAFTCARINFLVIADFCEPIANLVKWRDHGPNGAVNKFADEHAQSVPILGESLTPMSANSTPLSMICPDDKDVRCGSRTSPQFLGHASIDNSDCSYTVTYSDLTTGTCPGTIVRTWHIVAECGQVLECQQVITIHSAESE